MGTAIMRAFVMCYAIFIIGALALPESATTNEDSWSESSDRLVEPVLDKAKLGADRTTTADESSNKYKWLMKKLNDVRAKCTTPKPPIKELKVPKIVKRTVEEKLYHAEVIVDGVKKQVVFERPLSDEEKIHDEPASDGKANILDSFSLKHITPHPCGDDTATFTDETYETDAELDAKYQ